MRNDRRSSPSLIAGREPERARLRELLNDALQGHGCLVLLSGEAGIGKTTLVEDLAGRAAEQGVLAFTGHCYDLTATRPYAPWLEIMNAVGEPGSPVVRPDGEVPRPLLPNDNEDGAPIGHGDPVERTADFFATVAGDNPLMIALEDMHWSDHESLDALRHLARRVTALPLLLIVTYRDDELDQNHPLYRLLPTLVREARAERIELRRIGGDAMRDWMARRYPLSPRDHERLVGYLQANAEGNPFFATEMLRTLENDGVLRPTLAGWAVGELDSLGVPLLLRQVIDARLARLGDEHRGLLAVAAVIGHQAPLDVWGAVAGVPDEQLIGVVEAGVNQNLFVASENGRSIEFTHALIRATLYETILPPRRRGWHRQIADLLLQDDRSDPVLVVHHLQRGGDPRAPRWLIRAADRAYYAYAFNTAVEQYEAALALMDPDELTPAELGWMRLHLGQSYRYIDTQQALAHATESQAIATEVDDPVLLALTAWSRGQIRGLQGENSIDEIRGAYDMLFALPEHEFQRVWEIERLSRDLLTSAMTRWLALYGYYDEAVAVGEKHLATNPESDDVYSGLGIAYAALGRPDDAGDAFERALDYYQRHSMRQLAQVMTFTNLTWVTMIYRPDEVEERRRQAREAQDLWDRSASIRIDLDPQSDWAPVYLVEGRWDEVRRFARQMDSPAFHTSALGWLGQIARCRGEWDEAWEHLHEALPAGPNGDPAEDARPAFITMIVLINLAANLALDQDDLPHAERWIAMHDRWLDWCGATLGRAENQLLWARYHQQHGDMGSALDHAERALEHASNPRQPLALIVAYRLLGELETSRQRFAAAANHLDASLALSDDCAAPHERALTLLARADLLIALARSDEAGAALDEVKAICSPLEARPAIERALALDERLTARTRTSGHIAGLTGREIEVLRLVARGLTDAEVGERLFISPRTVSQHLRSVYNKLGVNSRAAAVAFGYEHGLV